MAKSEKIVEPGIDKEQGVGEKAPHDHTWIKKQVLQPERFIGDATIKSFIIKNRQKFLSIMKIHKNDPAQSDNARNEHKGNGFQLFYFV